ncbi:hypothetical protein C8Q75DRAFT_401970 [Abortiporus biennis]|nr:hypothetical protein C8Q75DRAFT_401970 [Abortiporus biennis]
MLLQSSFFTQLPSFATRFINHAIFSQTSPTDVVAPSFAPTSVIITSNNPSTPTVTQSSSETPSESATEASSGSLHRSDLPIGTVIGAIIGAFGGLALIILIFLWYLKRPVKRSRNARMAADQRRDRGRSWNMLGDNKDNVEGGQGSSPSQREMDEKNFPMFKKTNSIRTTRTARALEEHGIDLPPFEFSKYHPTLAEELSLQAPSKPFTERQDSGVSWGDNDTVKDDSFLSLRSVRMDSGTMSPTLHAGKATPVATVNAIHRWESAEVLTMDGDTDSHSNQNPFADATEESPRSTTNPFFGGGADVYRSTSRARSRSNSRSSRHSRNASRASRGASVARSQVVSEVPSIYPPDIVYPTPVPFVPTHQAGDSIASGSSGGAFAANEHAMKSLIAALDLTQEEVEERLRVASMQGSTLSRMSGVSQYDDESDIGTIRGFPIPPQTPQ